MQSSCHGLLAWLFPCWQFCMTLYLKWYFYLIAGSTFHFSIIFLHLFWLFCIFVVFPADIANHWQHMSICSFLFWTKFSLFSFVHGTNHLNCEHQITRRKSASAFSRFCSELLLQQTLPCSWVTDYCLLTMYLCVKWQWIQTSPLSLWHLNQLSSYLVFHC